MKNKEEIKKIVVFDFDNTLIFTGTLDEFKPIYKEKTGNEWDHKGFWGRRESLDIDIFPIRPLEFASNHYHKVKDEENILLILLTGRIKPLEKEVHKILDKFNFKFDQVLLNPTHDTLQFKLKELNRLVNEHPNVELVEFLDDRILHRDDFLKLGEELEKTKENFKFIYHFVEPNEIY